MPIVGTLAMIMSLIITFVGLPHQIYQNYQKKNCGFAPFLVFSAFCVYALWAIYGWTKPDYFLAISQTPGTILASVIVFQSFRYKKYK